MDYAVPQEL